MFQSLDATDLSCCVIGPRLRLANDLPFANREAAQENGRLSEDGAIWLCVLGGIFWSRPDFALVAPSSQAISSPRGLIQRATHAVRCQLRAVNSAGGNRKGRGPKVSDFWPAPDYLPAPASDAATGSAAVNNLPRPVPCVSSARNEGRRLNTRLGGRRDQYPVPSPRDLDCSFIFDWPHLGHPVLCVRGSPIREAVAVGMGTRAITVLVEEAGYGCTRAGNSSPQVAALRLCAIRICASTAAAVSEPSEKRSRVRCHVRFQEPHAAVRVVLRGRLVSSDAEPKPKRTSTTVLDPLHGFIVCSR